jgi:hypothetical protein
VRSQKVQSGGRPLCSYLLAVCLLLASACSNPQPAKVNGSLANSNQAGLISQWWSEEARHVQSQYFSAVGQSCRSAEIQFLDPFGYSGCVRSTILASLGAQSSGAPECLAEEGMPLFLLCVGLGTTAEQIFASLGTGAESSMDWHDPTQSFVRATMLLGKRLDTKCRYSRKSDCIAREMTHLFALNSGEADRCASAASMELQIRCTAILSLIEKYRSALLYVG